MPQYREDQMTTGERIEKIATNSWFTVLGRTSMMAAVPCLIYVSSLLIELKTDLRVLRVSFDILQAQSSNVYRATDAVRDLKLVQIQLDNATRRLDALERHQTERQQAR